jgi:pyruvate dehydrogenase E1 component
MFAAAGWQVITLKYGHLLEKLFTRPGGEALCARINEMTNPEYQRLLRCSAGQLRERLPAGNQPISGLVSEVDDETLLAAVRNLGGHDLAALDQAFAAIDDARPTVTFAYTITRAPTESLLAADPRADARAGREAWPRRRPAVAPVPRVERRRPAVRGNRAKARAPGHRYRTPPELPCDIGRTPSGTTTTQAALGRVLLDVTREAPEAAQRVVTVSPDVSSTTNLGGWVKQGRRVVGPRTGRLVRRRRRNHPALAGKAGRAAHRAGHRGDQPGRPARRAGRDLEPLGPLLPIGVLYDPFLGRALEPWSFGIYAGGQSIVVGTPSGVTLAPEGGAHQSITTPSLDLEQPGCITYEPAFALDVEWTLLASLARLGRPDGGSAYLRLSTRPVDQTLAAVPTDPAARERRRAQAVAGAYPLRRTEKPTVTIAAMGAVVPEALAAADRLTALGVATDVVCVTSPGLLFEASQARKGWESAPSWILDQVFPAARVTPLVTALDGHPHTLAFLASINQAPTVSLGVTGFGQSGSLAEVYRYHGIGTDSIIRGALDVLERS